MVTDTRLFLASTVTICFSSPMKKLEGSFLLLLVFVFVCRLVEVRLCTRKSIIHDVTLFGELGISVAGTARLLLWNNALRRTWKSQGHRQKISSAARFLHPLRLRFRLLCHMFGNEIWLAARRGCSIFYHKMPAVFDSLSFLSSPPPPTHYLLRLD